MGSSHGNDQGRGEKTRHDIVRSASLLFAAHGYHATGLGEILEAVTLSKGAFYHHFKSKELLAAAVLTRLDEQYRRELFEPTGRQADPAGRVEFALMRLAELNESGEWECCLLLARLNLELAQPVGELSEQLSRLNRTIIDFWREWLDEARRGEAVNPDLDPAAAAGLVHTAWLGAVSCRELDGQIWPLADFARYLLGLLS